MKWQFYKFGDFNGWVVPAGLSPKVMGGAIMIRPSSYREDTGETDPAKKVIQEQMFPGKSYELASPDGLSIDAESVNKVVLKIYNMSPETDGFVRWSATEGTEENRGRARFAMQPYHKEWQEVVCHIDGRWKGIIGRIWLTVGRLGEMGNIWIREISIERREPAPPHFKPDLCSDAVVPRISVPGITQDDFRDAFNVLNECTFTDAPISGMPYPLMGPGGGYGNNWWQLDTCLNIAGAKWANQSFCENIIRGFTVVQAMNPDGRIDLWGSAPIRGGCGDMSSMPKYFGAAYDVARRSGDPAFIEEVYVSVEKYLKWWLSPVKRNIETGLISGISEESAGGGLYLPPQTVAPVDLNVMIALGCLYVAELAAMAGRSDESRSYRHEFEHIREAINTYMWDDDRGAYFPYDLEKRTRRMNFICTSFDTMRKRIAPPDRVKRLISHLTDHNLFNWDTYPVTSIAKTEAEYVEAVGVYDGYAWYGDIWTLRNMAVISGLEDSGKPELAAELNWKTIKMFNAKYCEFLEPSNGTGHGVKRYGWSASQYIQAVIEHLFGIDYDAFKRRLTVRPNIPGELFGKTIKLSELIIPGKPGLRLNLSVDTDMNGKPSVLIDDMQKFEHEGLEICIIT